MVKPLAVAAILLSIILIPSAARPAVAHGAALIRISQRIESKHRVGVHDIQTAYLRDRKARRIGWSVLVCTPLGRGKILGHGSYSCEATFSFPLGRIEAAGVRKEEAPSYVFAVTGGTGFYNGTGGTLLVRGVGSTVELLLFSLET